MTLYFTDHSPSGKDRDITVNYSVEGRCNGDRDTPGTEGNIYYSVTMNGRKVSHKRITKAMHDLLMAQIELQRQAA